MGASLVFQALWTGSHATNLEPEKLLMEEISLEVLIFDQKAHPRSVVQLDYIFPR